MKDQTIKRVEGGVTYPFGFRASGIHCGLRKNKSKKDLALILADAPCPAAAVYTTNRVFGAPITVTREHLANGMAQAVICNSGNANTCNPDGVEKAHTMCAALANKLSIDPSDVIVASTGVIGMPLPLEPILNGIPALCEGLSDTNEAAYSAAMAIMTTDTRMKEIALNFTIGGKTVRLAGMAKGSGMIQPNMATMLCFLTTDADIAPEVLQQALKKCADQSFNRVSVDGDTSTNDMLCILASGKAGNERIASVEDDGYGEFEKALLFICVHLAKKIASDGEGASKLIECRVRGCTSEDGARILSKSVINSPLVKTAMFGADANWGRVLCALGYAGTPFDTSKVEVNFISSAGEVNVCSNGGAVEFDEGKAKEILLRDEIIIDIDLHDGTAAAYAWGCDLSYEYVRINGDYRS